MNIYYLKYWRRFRWNIYKKKIIHDFDQPVTKRITKKKGLEIVTVIRVMDTS